MKRVLVLVPILLLAGIAAPALADPRGIAMGGTDAAIARGADAVRWNPALLGLRGSPGFSMRLFQAGARADNNSFSVDQYKRFNGATWGEVEKAEILSSVPAEGLQIQSAAAGGSGVAFGPAGFYADGIGAGLGTVARDGVDFALNGNALDRTYSLQGSGGHGYASGRMLFGMAFPMGKSERSSTTFGIQVGFERGIRYEEGTTLQGSFSSGADTAQVMGDFLKREGTRGSGITVGAGYAASSPGGTFSVMVRDLYNKVTWTGTERRYHLRGSHGVHGTGNFDSLFTSSSDPETPAEFTSRRSAVVSLAFTRYLGSLTVASVTEKGLGESPGVSKSIRNAWGLEWAGLGPLALRGGLSLGGGRGTWFSGGVGLHAGPLHVDLGAETRGFGLAHAQGVGVSAGASLEM